MLSQVTMTQLTWVILSSGNGLSLPVANERDSFLLFLSHTAQCSGVHQDLHHLGHDEMFFMHANAQIKLLVVVMGHSEGAVLSSCLSFPDTILLGCLCKHNKS